MPGAPIQFARDVAPSLRRAVETGTKRGESTAALAEVFPDVVTIEIDDDLVRGARDRFAETPNVTVMHGDSGTVLRDVADPELATFYFLDAHWSGGETGGEEIDCPILAELAVLREKGNPDDVLVIDDLRVFDAPPESRRASWPSLSELERVVRQAYPTHRLIRADDQLLALNPRARRRVFVRALRRRVFGGKTRIQKKALPSGSQSHGKP